MFILIDNFLAVNEPRSYFVITAFAFSALTLLVGQQEEHPACKKTEWWGAGRIICLERGADLHMAQLMPLPLTVCVCVCSCVRACVRLTVTVKAFLSYLRSSCTLHTFK